MTVHSSSNPAEAGHKVVGVEISAKAVKDFFTENHLPHEQVQFGKLLQCKVILITAVLPSPLPPMPLFSTLF